MTDETCILPMSPAQQRLWFLDQMDPGTTMFNIPVAFRLFGPLDTEAVRRTFSAIVERHEVLRTTLTSLHGEPVQIIHPHREFHLQVMDLSPLSPDVRESALLRELRTAAATPFDLANGPLFRVCLWRLSSGHHAVLIAMHHAISDGWSLGVLFHEFDVIWAAASDNMPCPLPPLSIQYADYAHWHRNRMLSGELDRQKEYWLRQLEGYNGLLRLPVDRPRPATQTFDAGAWEFRLPERLVDALRAFGRETGVTLFMSCITAYGFLLARYSGQNDLCVGIPIAGRTQAELEPLIGFFVNGMLIRFRFDPARTVRDLMTEVRRTVLDAFSNQDLSIDALMESLSVTRDPAYEPLVQATFALQNLPSIPRPPSRLDVEPIGVECMHSRYDLMLLMTETHETIVGNMVYNTSLFLPATVSRMMRHLEQIMEVMCTAPDAPLAALSFVGQAELYDLLGLDPGTCERILPLTGMQRDIYVDTLANPASRQNNVGLAFEIHQSAINQLMDTRVWGECVQFITDSQPVLRTRVRASRISFIDAAYQCVLRVDRAPVEIHDLSHCALTDAEINVRLAGIVQRPYDPHGVLLRYALVRLSADRWFAVVANHHTVLDGLATVQLASTIAAEYSRRMVSSAVPDVPPPDRFHEEVPAIRAATDTAPVLAYWRSALAGVTPAVAPASAPGESKGPVSRDLAIPPETWTAIRQYCRKSRITPQILMKCVFALAADAHCRCEGDLLIQEFLAGRGPGHATTLGCYYQAIPFVVPRRILNGDSSCSSLFEHARAWQKEAPDHTPVSIFEQRRIAPPGRVSFLFNFITAALTIPVCNEIAEVRRFTPYADGFVQFEISTVGAQVHATLQYDPAIFAESGFLERVLSLIQQLLNGKERLADLSFLLPPENPALIAEPQLPFVPITDQIARRAARSPDEPAVMQGNTVLSFAQLHSSASHISAVLRGQGIGPGDLVGICIERSPLMIVAVLAVLNSGAAYVPMDSSYPSGRLQHIGGDARCRVILTESALLDRFDATRCLVLALDRPDRLSGLPEGEPAPPRRPDSLFYVLYTSGSTGAPKGAAVTDLGEWNLIRWFCREFEITPLDRLVVPSAFGFDLTQKNFFAALTSGAALVLPECSGFEPDRILAAVERHGATLLNCAPGAFYSLLEESRPAQLRTLRFVFLGGEPIRVGKMEAWLRSPECIAQVVNTYGPTECTDVVSFFRLGEPFHYLRSEVPLGSAIDNVRLYVLDESGRPLPPYGVGELYIAGVAVGQGYWRNPQLTRDKFVASPFERDLMYRTGDLVYLLPDGMPVFVGRRDFQLKIRGLRIEPGEIEAALSDATCNTEWLVLPIADQLLAFVRAEDPAASTIDLRAVLAHRLPDHMIPQAVIAVATWPLNPHGKIDRLALAQIELPQQKGVAEPPRTPTEIRLERIWVELLGRPGIGRDDSFFAVGGHSLLAARAVSRIRAEFGVELSLRAFFDTPSISALSEHIDRLTQPAQTGDELSELLAAMSGLPEEELERLLHETS